MEKVLGPVLVTGGNGHLGYNLVRALIGRGFRVRATVRDLNDTRKTAPLKALSKVEIVQMDLSDIQSIYQVMKGVEGVFHSAAPNLPWAPNIEKEIIGPIVQGTQGVVRVAAEAGIKKIVFTSSCSSIGMQSTAEQPLTEERWYLNAVSPLIKAKTEAELWATDFCKHEGINLISICPPSIVGPGFYRHTPGTRFYENLVRGKLPPLPSGGCHLVDVRDVAIAQWKAYVSPSLSGRYILAGRFFKIREFLDFIEELDPSLRFQKFQAPKWMVYFGCGIDWLLYQFSGKPRNLTLDMIREFVGKYQYVSTARAERDLEWVPRPAEETVLDTLSWIREHMCKEGVLQ